MASAFAIEGVAQPNATPTVYSRQHDVLVQAIKLGHAEGLLMGDAAELFQRQFKSEGALLVKADVIQSLAQPECKRLQLTYTKQDVIGPQDVVLNIKLNYCLNGRPPPSQKVRQ